MRIFRTIVIATALGVASGGCALTGPAPISLLGAPEPAPESASSEAAEVYQRIKQAKSQHAVVLQVAGDSEPIRVLPLPPDGRPVFVSDLLEQTGVFKRFGRVQAELFRDSPTDFRGVRMAVQLDQGSRVRPESDYALRPGDRLRVQADPSSALGDFLGGLLPANAVRAVARH